MEKPSAMGGLAYNPATGSENRIHSDEVAKQYGFRGGLVPGVTVYAYLVEPALVAWGADWLERGTAEIRLRRPLYDGGAYRVEVEAGGAGYDGAVIDAEGERCGVGRVELPDGVVDGDLPTLRGDPPAPPFAERRPVSRAVLEELREKGLGALEVIWREGDELERTHQHPDEMLDLVRIDRGGFANPSFGLGLANSALSRNVRLGPWIHVESRARNRAAIPLGTRLHVESRVLDLSSRNGHEYVDLEVEVFDERGRPTLSVWHRAIYRLRSPD